VAKSEVATFGNRRVLIVERFDRQLVSDGRLLRRPQEHMCQALSIPSVLKHENDGGPGVVDIMKLLASSDTPDVDQRRFFEAVVAFWWLGATDGHAKSFSVFLSPSGRFKATLLYDVLSAQPSLDDRQIETKQMRLAMAAGDRRGYRIGEISPRHLLQTAAKAGFAERLGREVFEGLRTRGEGAVERLLARLPDDFPAAVSDGIARGFLDLLDYAEEFTRRAAAARVEV
jgi:serine/threonine-protein kinase HipA